MPLPITGVQHAQRVADDVLDAHGRYIRVWDTSEVITLTLLTL